MHLAIEVMNVGRINFSHMAAGVTVILKMEIVLEHMRIKDLHGTNGEMLLQDQEIY